MGSSVELGNRLEKLCVEELKKLGFTAIHRTLRTQKQVGMRNGKPIYVSFRNDVHNAFDVIASKDGVTRYIQVSTDQNTSHKKEKCNENFDVHDPLESVEIWEYYKTRSNKWDHSILRRTWSNIAQVYIWLKQNGKKEELRVSLL